VDQPEPDHNAGPLRWLDPELDASINKARERAAYVLTVRLNDLEPRVWRQIAIPGHFALDRLHDIVQIVAGWHDSRLYAFEIDGDRFVEKPGHVGGTEDRYFPLCYLFPQAPAEFRYVRDLWHQRISVDRIIPQPANHPAKVVCLGGFGAYPPDDCIDVRGYRQVLEALSSPDPKLMLGAASLLGKNFDPRTFDSQAVNAELAKYERWSRGRSSGVPGDLWYESD
jgi:hypothetical protein